MFVRCQKGYQKYIYFLSVCISEYRVNYKMYIREFMLFYPADEIYM